MKISHFVLLSVCFLCAGIANAVPGVTDHKITIGQSAALSGSTGRAGTEMRDGALAYLAEVNAKGGIYGRQVELKTLDDSYDPSLTTENTESLVEDSLALYGYVGTPTSMAALKQVTKENVPFIAPMTGAVQLREPYAENIFHIRVGYQDEIEAIVAHQTMLGMKKFAIMYQNDGFGAAGLEGLTKALKKRNLNVYASAPVERGSTYVADAVAKLSQAQPDVILMVSTYTTVAEFVKEIHKTPCAAFLWTISFVDAEALVAELGKNDDVFDARGMKTSVVNAKGVMISEVMPAPWDPQARVVREYQKSYRKFLQNLNPKATVEYTYPSLEGYLSMETLVEGLRRCGKSLTREGLIKALESMQQVDLGGFRIDYGPGHHDGVNPPDLTIVRKDGHFLH